MFLKLQSFAHSMLRNMKNAIITIYGLMNYINFQAIAKRNKHAYIYCCAPWHLANRSLFEVWLAERKFTFLSPS
jgi:hypothetical protein